MLILFYPHILFYYDKIYIYSCLGGNNMLNSTRIQTLLALEKLIKSAEEINLKIIKEPENTDRDYFLKTAQFAQHMLSSCCYYEDNRKKKIGFFRILPNYDHNPVMRILTDDYEATYELSIQLDELIAKYYNQGYKCGQSLRHN